MVLNELKELTAGNELESIVELLREFQSGDTALAKEMSQTVLSVVATSALHRLANAVERIADKLDAG